MYSKPPLRPAVDGPQKEHDQWHQELKREQGHLREGIHELRGWLVDNFQNVIGCLRNDILDAGNNLFQSHCYAPTGRIVRRAGSGYEVVSRLQFGVAQVLVEQGSRPM